MEGKLSSIPIREVLHYLGWRGTPVDEATLAGIREMTALALREIQPRTAYIRRRILEDGSLEGTSLTPDGNEVRKMLAPCRDAILLAGTLGAQSERLLLRIQAQDAAKALIMDAVLSAGIEALLDEREEALRAELTRQGQYLTDRFSPGYGDMPMAQTREICAVLDTQRRIGLTVSSSGIMIPRKSVVAIMGVGDHPVERRPKGCAACPMRDTCALARK